MKLNLIFIVYYILSGISVRFLSLTYEEYDFIAFSLGLFFVILVIYNTYKVSEYIKNRLFKK